MMKVPTIPLLSTRILLLKRYSIGIRMSLVVIGLLISIHNEQSFRLLFSIRRMEDIVIKEQQTSLVSPKLLSPPYNQSHHHDQLPQLLRAAAVVIPNATMTITTSNSSSLTTTNGSDDSTTYLPVVDQARNVTLTTTQDIRNDINNNNNNNPSNNNTSTTLLVQNKKVDYYDSVMYNGTNNIGDDDEEENEEEEEDDNNDKDENDGDDGDDDNREVDQDNISTESNYNNIMTESSNTTSSSQSNTTDQEHQTTTILTKNTTNSTTNWVDESEYENFHELSKRMSSLLVLGDIMTTTTTNANVPNDNNNNDTSNEEFSTVTAGSSHHHGTINETTSNQPETTITTTTTTTSSKFHPVQLFHDFVEAKGRTNNNIIERRRQRQERKQERRRERRHRRKRKRTGSKKVPQQHKSDDYNTKIIPDWGIGTIQPKPFTVWSNNNTNTNISLPCIPAEKEWYKYHVHHTPSKEGFLYVKAHKTGSSTSAGINLRIARNVAKRLFQNNQFPMCKCRFDHGRAYQHYKDRDYNKSYLWSIIRDPTKRAISAFFHFGVSRHTIEPTDYNFQKFVRQKEFMDIYLTFLYPKGRFERFDTDPMFAIDLIQREYNFIGITERMEESAVVLMMLLNLPMADILYLTAKEHGGYDDGGGINGCQKITSSFLSPAMFEFFNSTQWQSFIKYDQLLYDIVNQSLDRTIDQLGRDTFNNYLVKYKYALA